MTPPPTTNTGYPPLHHQHQHQHHASASDSPPILEPPIPASHSTQTPTATAPSPASVTPHAGSPSHPRPHHHRGPPPPFDPRNTHGKKEEELRRNLQARGKNYNIGSSSTSSNSNNAGKSGTAQASRAWGYEERQRRDEAAGILESEEMVMWIAGVRNESITQTRAYYRNVLLGLETCAKDALVWRDEWEGTQQQQGRDGEGSGSPGRSGKGKEREIAKMRKRVSLGVGQ